MVRVQSQGDATKWLRDGEAVARWERGYMQAGGRVAPGTDKGWLGQFASTREKLRSAERGRER